MAAISSSFVPVQLFGGALQANLPEDFIDVSTIRDVPSNQEIYLHRTSLVSVIIEILEYAAPPDHPCASDAEALEYHYKDIVSAGMKDGQEETTQSFNHKEGVMMEGLTKVNGMRALSVLGIQTPTAINTSSSAETVEFTALLVTLVRLPYVKTDLLVTVNVPHVRGAYEAQEIDFAAGKWGREIESGRKVQREVERTLVVKEWGLFGED